MSMRRVYKQINLDVGARLRACRERAHLTREAFAEQVGITPRFVADIECGRVGASLTTLTRACEVLGASADEILWGEASAAKSAGEHLAAMLAGVDPELLPILEESIRTQVRLVAAAKKQETP